MSIQWEQVRDQFIDGQIEVQRNGTVTRGPISRMVIAEDRSRFTFYKKWCAQKNDSGLWGMCHEWEFSFDPRELLPREIGGNCLRFRPLEGRGAVEVTLFPSDHPRNIDKSEVIGLDLIREGAHIFEDTFKTNSGPPDQSLHALPAERFPPKPTSQGSS